MLELFISIALNSLEKGSKSHLLFASKSSFLLVNNLIDLLFLAVSLLLFLNIALDIKFFGFLVSFGVHKLLDLLSHFHELLSECNLGRIFLSDSLMELLDLQQMLLLQLFQRQVRCCFIVTHVVVPSRRKLQELRSLCRFNCNELLFLGLFHILKLPKHFFVFQVFKLEGGSPCFSEIHLFAALLSVII